MSGMKKPRDGNKLRVDLEPLGRFELPFRPFPQTLDLTCNTPIREYLDVG